MDCRSFRDNHSLYVDLRCSAVEEDDFRRHAAECERCARHDMLVRRSLMLVRNLPTIEPSPDFQARLHARLRGEPVLEHAPRRLSYRMVGAIAATLVFALAASSMLYFRSRPDAIMLAPVVATLPEDRGAQVATPALVATVPTGMSVWPALMVASQASVHFVAAELASER
jgi:hypothetical protein